MLAAGRGTRLGTITQDIPKTLVPVCGKPFCHTILNSFKPHAFQKMIVVGGFQYQKLKEALDHQEARLTLIENKNHSHGNLLTLLAAQSLVTGSFLITNADHLFSADILNLVFKQVRNLNQISIVCDFDRTLGPDDMKVKENQGQLCEMDKKLNHFNAGYIGLTFVPFLKRELYWQRAHHLLQTKGKEVHVERVTNDLASTGESIAVVDASGSWWIEIDTAEDLKNAEEKLIEKKMYPLSDESLKN